MRTRQVLIFSLFSLTNTETCTMEQIKQQRQMCQTKTAIDTDGVMITQQPPIVRQTCV